MTAWANLGRGPAGTEAPERRRFRNAAVRSDGRQDHRGHEGGVPAVPRNREKEQREGVSHQ
jgi:hypothetical protein